MKPAVSIVVYKNNGSTQWKEEAYLSGSLASKGNMKSYLNMIQINSKRWKDVDHQTLKTF